MKRGADNNIWFRLTIGCLFFLVCTVFSCFVLQLNPVFAIGNTLDPNLWITDHYVYNMIVSNNDLYIGGSFTYVGPYTGGGSVIDIDSDIYYDSSLPKIAVDFDLWVYVRVVIPDGNGGWFVGGSFDRVDSANHAKLIHIKPDKSLDTNFNPNPDGNVWSLFLSGSDLYVGGQFTSIGGQTRNRIAKLNSTTGTADLTFNPNASSTVYSLLLSGSDLYVGGSFTTIGGQTRNRIAKLNTTDGLADLTFNPNAGSTVRTLLVSGSDLYVGGSFTTIGGQTRNRIAKLSTTTGTADLTFNPDANVTVYSLALSGSDLYVGGEFSTIGGQTRNRIAKLNTTDGTADPTFDPSAGGGGIYSLSLSESNLYVGGDFISTGGKVRNMIAKINKATGEVDTTFNPNANGTVESLLLSGSDLYVGGGFTTIGGQTRNHIAKLNTTDGLADPTFDPNASSTVSALALSGSDLYVGGQFTSIGGQSRNYIAKLNTTDGSANVTFNPNANNQVRSLLPSGSDLYVGGQFTSIGGQSRNYIAKLNTTDGLADLTFNPTGGGTIYSLLLSDSDLYVGGDFNSIGGQTRKKVAKLNATTGVADSTFGDPNVSDNVYSLVLSDSDLYIGGQFYTVASQDIKYVAKLNSTTGAVDATFNLNHDSSGFVNSLALSGSDLYIGGGFYSVGGNDSYRHILHLYDTIAPSLSLSSLSPDPNGDSTSSITGTAIDGEATVDSVEYQMDSTSGSWIACTADDGTFDEASEDFTCTVAPALADGEHTIYVRATDSNSNTTAGGSEESDTFTIDTTAPIITIGTPKINNFGADIIWTTNEDSSSMVDYGLTSSYGSTTLELDTSPRVTNHSVTIAALQECTTYHYRVRSKDGALNEVTGTDNTFETFGCSEQRVDDGDNAPNSIPRIYSAVAQGTDSIQLFFTGADEPVEYYDLQFGTKSGEYTWGAIKIGDKYIRSYLAKSLSPNTTYYFRIRAGNGNAASGWSNEISATTKGYISFNQLNITNSTLESIPGDTSTEQGEEQTGETAVQIGYKLKIKVIDTEKQPVVGAKVTIHSKVQESITNESGIAEFENVEPGDHKVLIAYNGYEGEQSINLTGNVKEFDLTVTIEKKAVFFSPIFITVTSVLGLALLITTIVLVRSRSHHQVIH